MLHLAYNLMSPPLFSLSMFMLTNSEMNLALGTWKEKKAIDCHD